jgi:hypothetical protein
MTLDWGLPSHGRFSLGSTAERCGENRHPISSSSFCRIACLKLSKPIDSMSTCPSPPTTLIAIVYVETLGGLLRKNMLRRLYDNRQSIDDDTFPNQRVTNGRRAAIPWLSSPSPETSMTFLPPVNSWSNRASQNRSALPIKVLIPICGRCVCLQSISE